MITVVDLGLGNIGSVLKALTSIDAPIRLTKSPEDILKASKIILPGVGSFGAGMRSIRSLGLREPLRESALVRKIPFLGICMGMQILAETGHENGKHEGLGIISGEVNVLDRNLCPHIPHMGWNNLESTDGNALLAGLPEKPDFYFVHSYQLKAEATAGITLNFCTYGELIMACLAKQNIFGTQFHPEKSQRNGLKVLKNFLDYA